MAKIKMPLLSQIANNKIGDVVFYRRGDFGINVARIRVIPHNPKTVNQVNVRDNLKKLTQLWLGRIQAPGTVFHKYNAATKTWTDVTIASTETFGNAERKAWENYTHITRQGYKVKGRLAFVGVNQQRLYQGLNPLKTPTKEFSVS